MLRLGTGEIGAWARGVAAYKDARRPALPIKPAAIWDEGTTQLRDYGGPAFGNKDLVLVVPSLINRAGILDLLNGHSLLRYLSNRQRVWLVDWDAPGETELTFSIDDYIARLLRIVAHAQATGLRVHLLGYCMGGLLALAAAQLAAQPLDSLTLLATPWDFSAYAPTARIGIGQWHMALKPWLAANQPVPVDILQALFALLQPMATYEKFKRAGTKGIDDLFVAVEDWLNDGVVLPAQVAETCFGYWFTQNLTAAGQWKVLGQAIDPKKLTLPTLIVAPQRDQLVPPAAASALARALPNAQLLSPAMGHIGMIVGRQAKREVWDAVQGFISGS